MAPPGLEFSADGDRIASSIGAGGEGGEGGVSSADEVEVSVITGTSPSCGVGGVSVGWCGRVAIDVDWNPVGGDDGGNDATEPIKRGEARSSDRPEAMIGDGSDTGDPEGEGGEVGVLTVRSNSHVSSRLVADSSSAPVVELWAALA